MKLHGVQVFVEDIAKARHFYGRVLRLRAVKHTSVADSVVYALGTGELVVTAANKHGPNAALIGRYTGVTLATINLEAIYRRVGTVGEIFDAPPRTLESGMTVARIRDPSHNVFTLVQKPRRSA
jgi:catechol 2,3-dioxygenase-like lactoylglutathione lyase family enzyme